MRDRNLLNGLVLFSQRSRDSHLLPDDGRRKPLVSLVPEFHPYSFTYAQEPSTWDGVREA